MTTVGLDIGGANIKAADEGGHAVSRVFAIWREPEKLSDEIAALLRLFPQPSRVAVTMTAELADCFTTKSEGVRFILDAVDTCVRNINDRSPAEIDVWSTEGRFLSTDNARDRCQKVAAANWHALATWSGRLVPTGSAVLMDIGTTTTDIIPLHNGRPIPMGLTDVGRLQSGELSYSGARRTPICAIAHSVPLQGGYCSIAAEVFATTLDVYLLTGNIADDEHDRDTANGKPATKSAAYDRLVRMLCCDRDEVTLDEAVQIARFLADVQRQRLAGSFERVAQRLPDSCQQVILSGSGLFLAHRIAYENRHTANARVISLSDQLSPSVATAACAYAVAQMSAGVHG